MNFYPHSTPFHVDLVICRHTFYFIFLPVLFIILIHYNFNVTSVSTEKPPWGVLINLYCIDVVVSFGRFYDSCIPFYTAENLLVMLICRLHTIHGRLNLMPFVISVTQRALPVGWVISKGKTLEPHGINRRDET